MKEWTESMIMLSVNENQKYERKWLGMKVCMIAIVFIIMYYYYVPNCDILTK